LLPGREGFAGVCPAKEHTRLWSGHTCALHVRVRRVYKEERNYTLGLVKKIKASGCNVLLIQKSILRDATTGACTRVVAAVECVGNISCEHTHTHTHAHTYTQTHTRVHTHNALTHTKAPHACLHSHPAELSLHYLAKAKIMVVRDVERDEIEFISKVRVCVCTCVEEKVEGHWSGATGPSPSKSAADSDGDAGRRSVRADLQCTLCAMPQLLTLVPASEQIQTGIPPTLIATADVELPACGAREPLQAGEAGHGRPGGGGGGGCLPVGVCGSVLVLV